MIRVGFVGAGFMGQGVDLPNFLARERCEVIALAEARPRLREAVAQRHQIPRTYASHRELAADPDVQAVAAITSEQLHREIVPDLLAAGKHVYIEKPIASRLEDAQAMVEQARRSGVILMVGYMKRYDPGVRWARDRIRNLMDSGELGPPTFARAHCFGGAWVCGYAPPLIRTDEPAPGAEPVAPAWLPEDLRPAFFTFNNVYCHNLNLLRFLLGDEVEVGPADRVGGVTAVLLRIGGVPVSLETGALDAHRWDEHAQVYFREGWVLVETPPPLLPNVPARVRVYRGKSARELDEPFPAWGWSFRLAAEHFLECIEQGREPDSSGADALRDLEIVEAVFRRIADSRAAQAHG
jgi:predicted dehydrogenase